MKKLFLAAVLISFASLSFSAPVSKDKIESQRKNRDTTMKILLKTGKFTELVREEKNTMRAATPGEKENGYILFSRDYTEPIYHNTVPVAKDVLLCKSFGSPGEYIPLTFSVYPLKDLKSAKVSSAGLSCGSEKIGAENFEFRTVWHMPKRSSPGMFTMKPWLLEKKDTLDIEAGEKLLWGAVNLGPTRQWWITVKIPEEAKPGIYKGTIEFSPANTKASSVPVEIEVLPIKLVSSKNFNMWFFDDPNINNEKILKSLKEHGLYGNFIGFTPKVSADGLDFESFDKFVAFLQKNGLNANIMLASESLSHQIASILKTQLHSASFASEGRRMIEKFNKQVKDKYKGSVDICYFGIDEPANSEDRRKALTPLIKWLKTIEGVKVAETLNSPEMYPLYGPYTDINMGYAKWSDLDRAFLASGKDKRLSLNSWIDSGSILRARLEPGLFPWKNNYSLMNMWSFSSSGGDPLNDLDSGDPDWCITGPCENDTEDIMPAVNYESIRKGIDDRRYVVTLEQVIEKAKGDPALTAKADAAKRLLDSCTFIGDKRDATWTALKDPEGYKIVDKFKRDVADKIIELEQGLNSKK